MSQQSRYGLSILPEPQRSSIEINLWHTLTKVPWITESPDIQLCLPSPQRLILKRESNPMKLGTYTKQRKQ